MAAAGANVPGVPAQTAASGAEEEEEDTTISLPVLDMSLLEEAGGPERLGMQMATALEETGFFFIRHHGVPQRLINDAFGLAERFHALSLEEKLRFDRDPYGTGYLPLGTHTRPGFYAKPSGNAAFFLRFPDTEAAHNQWPNEEEGPGSSGTRTSVSNGYRALAISYMEQLQGLAWKLLPVLALALRLPPDFFEEAFAGAQTSWRLSHYPEGSGCELSGAGGGIAGSPAGSGAARIGVAPHTDSSIFTLLADSGKPGLELCLPDGSWVRPQPMPGTFLVNSGDLLRRWTNHKFLSTLHRVVNHPGQERYAIPFFLMGPRSDFSMVTLPGCASGKNPNRYEPITLPEFMKGWRAGEDKHIRTLTPAQVRAAYEGGFLAEDDQQPQGGGAAASKL